MLTATQPLQLKDQLQRPMHDLRLSVIDRCNFRCTYCMPATEYTEHYNFLNKNDWLSYDEITRLVKLFVKQGVAKVRITGGEPLLRPNLTQLIERLVNISGITDLALTTNGSLLHRYAHALRAAGLNRLTVSLDTLNEETFQSISGQRGKLADVLKGLKTAQAAGFQDIKINVVIQRGVNDHDILDLVNYFKGSGHILRFIEYMDVGNCNHWRSELVVPSKEVHDTINAIYPLTNMQSNYYGEVASRYQFKDGSGEIGFISSVTQPFCGSCTRLRLSTDGKVYTCLFAGKGTDLRSPLRSSNPEIELTKSIKEIWGHRKDRYSEERSCSLLNKQKPLKVEMFQIGG